jgi:hypothetical protein
MGDLPCAIHQPNFFPRLSTLAKLFTADIWVVLDDVQFARRDYQHRCRVTGPDGTERWLTVPVHLSAGRDTLIQDVIVADPDHASARVSSIIRRDYRHSRYWPDVRDQVTQVQEVFAHSDRLTEISEASTLALLRALGWTGAVYRSSELMARPGRSQHLADLTVAAGAGTYLCGTGGARYLDPAPFDSGGISVAWFRPPDRPGCPAQGNRATALGTVATTGPGTLSGWLAEHAEGWRLPRRAALSPPPWTLSVGLPGCRSV